jgi:hypothetical protein
MKYSTSLGSSHTPLSPAAESAGAGSARPSAGPIVLYCDLSVDPNREQEMLRHFHQEFKPAAEKFAGYIDVKIVRLRKVIQGGPAPAEHINFRFQLTYESEEKRQLWIASEVHARVWPLIENTLIDKGYLVLLTDSV